jgi:hypothetical protein
MVLLFACSSNSAPVSVLNVRKLQNSDFGLVKALLEVPDIKLGYSAALLEKCLM